MVTAIGIKIFFRFNTKLAGKPRIKNTISFKRLNIIYGLGLIFSASLTLVFMKNESRETYVAHYTVSLVLNSMLLSLILTDKDARIFFHSKFLAWKDRNLLHMKKINLFKTKCKITPVERTTEKFNQYGIQSVGNSEEPEENAETASNEAARNVPVFLCRENIVVKVETPEGMDVIDIE